MAAASLVFKNGHTKIDSLELDVTISESHTGEVEITEHPVEEGFSVADHARPKQNNLTLTGLVSNTPISADQKKRTVEVSGIKLETTALKDQIQGVAGYAENAETVLRNLKDTGKVITVYTHIRTYQNMILASLSIPRDGRTGDALQFTATFRQIRIVKNKTTKKVVAKEPKAQPKANAGKQTPKDAGDTKKKSIAYKTAEKLGLLSKMGITK